MQGWGGPAVQYRQSSPVPEKFGTCNGLAGPPSDTQYWTGNASPMNDQKVQSANRPLLSIFRLYAYNFVRYWVCYWVFESLQLVCTQTRAVSFRNPYKLICRRLEVVLCYYINVTFLRQGTNWDLNWELLVCRIWGLDGTGRSSRHEDRWTGGLIGF